MILERLPGVTTIRLEVAGVFYTHFCRHLCTPSKTSQLITHSEIAPGQARLTLEFLIVGIRKKKVYLDGMSILSILLSIELRCYNPPPSKIDVPRQERFILAMSVRPVLAYAYRTMSLLEYPRVMHTYPTSLTRVLPYPSQLGLVKGLNPLALLQFYLTLLKS
jgi:hypothetical protein